MNLDKILEIIKPRTMHTSDRAYTASDLANLGACKGELAVVELQQSLEVDKYALSGLWPQVPRQVPSGSDGCGKHEVELQGVRDGVASNWRFHLILPQQLA